MKGVILTLLNIRLNEHFAIKMTSIATPQNGSQLVPGSAPQDTDTFRLEEGVTHYQESAPKRNRACLGCLHGFGLLVVANMAIAVLVSAAAFAISGGIFLGEEWGDIPDCGKAYKAWGVAMVVVHGLAALRSRNGGDESHEGGLTAKQMAIAYGIGILIVSVLSFLIAFLGRRDVYLKPDDTCDLSGIPQLVEWTQWILWFYGVLTLVLWVGGVGCIVMGCYL